MVDIVLLYYSYCLTVVVSSQPIIVVAEHVNVLTKQVILTVALKSNFRLCVDSFQDFSLDDSVIIKGKFICVL